MCLCSVFVVGCLLLWLGCVWLVYLCLAEILVWFVWLALCLLMGCFRFVIRLGLWLAGDLLCGCFGWFVRSWIWFVVFVLIELLRMSLLCIIIVGIFTWLTVWLVRWVLFVYWLLHWFWLRLVVCFDLILFVIWLLSTCLGLPDWLKVDL